MLTSYFLSAQTPVLKVDLNIGSRNEAEVNEPGYTPWPIKSGPDSMTIEGVKIVFKNGPMAAAWYKAGIQAPNYARFVNDGIATNNLEMHISGLKNGKHSLVTFHNNVDSPDGNIFSPIDIYMNDSLVVDNLEPTTRVLANDAASTFFTEFEVKNNEPVVFHFKTDLPSADVMDKLIICGFHLNASDPKRMAYSPFPGDKNEHVNIDNDTLIFRWAVPANTQSHQVYFGTNKDDVFYADTTSPLFIGDLNDTSMVISGFYSMNEYYWRVDPIDSEGKRTKGDIWYFKKRIPAFPDAEGYGRYALGGRGGDVAYVTNLNDSGPGSFRNAVETAVGPRTILFGVSGLITLDSRLVISKDNITVAGQTAPGKGICFRWAPIGVTGDNLVVQNIRVRLGAGVTYDGMGLTGAESSIIDHCSISWTIDESFSSRGAKNITLQRTLISEALNSAHHANYPAGSQHGFAASIGGDIGSFHHNLLAHCLGRNWSLAGGLDGNGIYAGRLDLFNNVVYNWDTRTTDGGAHEVNFVNNYYKPGASTTMRYALNAQYDQFPGTQRYYFAGNVMPGVFDETTQSRGKKYEGSPQGYSPWVDKPFFESDATIHSARDAYKIVLSDVGATQPVFDDHDIRIIDETLNTTFSCRGSVTNKPGLPDSEKDVGGWEEYPGFLRSANWDSDLDGLPNWWEKSHNLDTNSVANSYLETNADTDRNGYTNLEEYIQWMSKPHYFLSKDEELDIDLSMYTKGFTNAPTYTVSSTINGFATIDNEKALAHFTPKEEGMASFNYRVKDADGTEMLTEVGIYVGEIAADSAFEYTYEIDRPKEPEDTTSIKSNNNLLFNVGIYPNPAFNNLSLNIAANQGEKALVKIMNISGTTVYSKQIELLSNTNVSDIDISYLSSGIYFISTTINGYQKNLKFIKR